MITGELFGTAFGQALEEVGEPPCSRRGGCKNYSKCADLKLACKQFFLYVEGKLDGVPGPVGHPTRKMYERVFVKEEQAGRPKAATFVCSECGQEKPLKTGFPQSSTRCYECQPKRAKQMAAACRAYRARKRAEARIA